MDSKLKEYATESELRYIAAIEEFGSHGKASKALGVNRASVSKAMKRLKVRAAKQGYAPEHDMTRPVPEGFTVKGVSTYYNDEGKPTGQWVKSQQDKDAQMEALINRIEAITETVKPLKPVKPPKDVDKDTLTIYPLGDPHVGMYAWSKEAGEDFDCDIARQDLVNAMAYLVEAAPPSKECLVLNVGDFFHADDPSNATPGNKNQLDVDGRWARVLEMGFFILIDLISMALKKHEVVRVRSTPGNHDPKSTIPLTLFVRAWFKDDPRVVVEDATAIYQYQAFGKCLFGFTHGDKLRRLDELGALMAVDCADHWSGSTHRYWLHGHFHSKRVLEVMGCLVEGVRNLAPNDAWHQGSGYRSGRDMQAITYHRDYGEIARNTCDITRVRA